eukprot:GDKJ01033257.1.p1 GENE.GDKJ01033257.1~~GDKJ01033257.1.p1  ORF type:complete len:280 (+),score=54.78 GDKJ01033257.1:1-840(+)
MDDAVLNSFSTVRSLESQFLIDSDFMKTFKMEFEKRKLLVESVLNVLTEVPAFFPYNEDHITGEIGFKLLALLPSEMMTVDGVFEKWPYLVKEIQNCENSISKYVTDGENVSHDREVVCDKARGAMNEIQSHRSIVSNACQIPIPPSEDIAKLLSAIDIFPMKRETIENFCSEGSNQRLQAKMILLNDGDFRALNAATLEGYPCGFDPNTELFPTEFEQINCDSPAENNVISYSYLHPCGKAAFDFQKVLENTPSLKESVLHFSRTLNDKAQSFASISG